MCCIITTKELCVKPKRNLGVESRFLGISTADQTRYYLTPLVSLGASGLAGLAGFAGLAGASFFASGFAGFAGASFFASGFAGFAGASAAVATEANAKNVKNANANFFIFSPILESCECSQQYIFNVLVQPFVYWSN